MKNSVAFSFALDVYINIANSKITEANKDIFDNILLACSSFKKFLTTIKVTRASIDKMSGNIKFNTENRFSENGISVVLFLYFHREFRRNPLVLQAN